MKNLQNLQDHLKANHIGTPGNLKVKIKTLNYLYAKIAQTLSRVNTNTQETIDANLYMYLSMMKVLFNVERSVSIMSADELCTEEDFPLSKSNFKEFVYKMVSQAYTDFCQSY